LVIAVEENVFSFSESIDNCQLSIINQPPFEWHELFTVTKMSTVVVVKKNGYAAMAADTLTTWGSTKESAEYVVNHNKIISYKDNFLGITGAGSFQMPFVHFLENTKQKILFDNPFNIFQAGLMIHRVMKELYFVRPDEENAAFETFQADILIANPHGIFGMTEYRYVQEFSKFYAYGSGCDYALGAMFAVYHEANKSAEEIAKIGVSAGTEFDDGSGLPIDCHTVKLK
jgi:ATP-dependent protease HslVU (ClpYQ) peptidase subunit